MGEDYDQYGDDGNIYSFKKINIFFKSQMKKLFITWRNVS